MRKTFLPALLVLLLSCTKETVSFGPDYFLLQQFDWHSVSDRQVSGLVVPGSSVSFSDTTVYSFDAGTYSRKGQDNVLHMTSGSPGYQVQKLHSLQEGRYEVRAADSTLQLTYHQQIGGHPAWNIPGRDTVFTVGLKVLSLSKEKLIVRTLGALPPVTETFLPLEKK